MGTGFKKGLDFLKAVRNSNWEMIKWLHEMGYSKESDPDYLFSDDPKIIQWLKDRGIEFNEETLEWAEQCGSIETIEWLKKNI